MTSTLIERVRVRADGVDAVTARLRLAYLLADADLRPAGLPPAALLLVRRLPDPRPGTLGLDAGGMRPPPEWARAFVAALERCLRGAARPAREHVPAGAEAVLFADRAELLSCLARDACDGTAWARWWWRGMLAPVRERPDPVAAVWLSAPEHCPAALELLAARGEAARFARTVPAPVAVEVAARAASAFAAPELRAAIVAPPRVRPRVTATARPAWREAVPESAEPGLAPEQQLVLGVLLALRRVPAAARSATFAVSVERWRATVHAPAPRPAPAPALESEAAPLPAGQARPAHRRSAPAAGRPAAALPARGEPPWPRAADAPVRARTERPRIVERAPVGSREPSAPPPVATPARPPGETDPAPALTPRRAAQLHETPAEPSSATPAPIPVALPPLLPPVSGEARSPAPSARPARPRATPSDVEPSPPPPTVVEPLALAADTELGGVFYLINLGLRLDLYGDFTQPRTPGLGLDPWDFVALLGGWLLRGDDRRADPVWALLAGLAGRGRGEPPGRGFRPPRAWRVPPAWLEPVACNGVWRWSAAADVLRIVHPGGFPAVAVPRTAAAPAEHLRAELRRLHSPAAVRTALPREPAPPLARWVARLGAYAEVRLAWALGLADPRAVAGELLSHRARVLVSHTHVDVELSLAELPLAIRVAGLDRTPGWIPAAGHFVAFHFT